MGWPCALQQSIALPDVHSGYGFAIGNVAAFNMADPEAVVAPGGIGFDIKCVGWLCWLPLSLAMLDLKADPTAKVHVSCETLSARLLACLCLGFVGFQQQDLCIGFLHAVSLSYHHFEETARSLF